MVGDELGTFYWYTQLGEFIPYHAHWDANNHLINSALSIVFYNLFGSAEWSLRLGSVLFFPLYLFYSYKLASLLDNKWLRLGLVIALWFAHNFIEFFGLCRGYGMSMALLVTAIYFTIRFIQQPNNKYLLLALLFNVLMLTANLSILNTFVLINLALFTITIINYKQLNKLVALAGFAILSAGPGLFFVKYLFDMKERGLLYYGTTEGFITVTLNTVSELILSTQHYIVIGFIIALFYALLLLYGVNKLKHLKNIRPVDLLMALLVGNVVMTYFLGLVMKVNYPEDRVGMYLYPLFALAAFFIADTVKYKWKYVLVLPFIYIPIHFVFSANVTHSKVWAWEHIPRRYFDVVAGTGTHGYPPIVSGYKMRTLTWAYFNMRTQAHQNQIQETNFRENTLSDFIITRTGEVKGIDSLYTKLDFDEPSGLGLYKRKFVFKRKFMSTATIADKLNSTDEYINLCTINGDTVTGKNLLFEIDCKVKMRADEIPYARLIVDVIDITGKSISYNYQQLDWLYGKTNDNVYDMKQSFVLPNIPSNTGHIAVYFWSIKKRPLDFTKGSIKVYAVE